MTPSTPSGLDAVWEALAADIHANGYSVRDAIAAHRAAIEREAVEAYRLAQETPPQRPFVYGYADGHAPLPEGAAPSLDVERLTYFLVAAAVHDGMQGDFPSIRAEAEWIAAQWNDPDSITNARLAAYLRESLPQPQDET